MKNLTLPIACLLLFLVQACSPARLLRQDDVYKPGFSLAIEQSTESQTRMELFGEEMVQNTTNSTEYELFFAEQMPNGDQKWEMLITRFVMEGGDNDEVVTTYDSSNPDRDTSEAATKILEKMIGHRMLMTCTHYGKVLSFSGADDLFDNLFAKMDTVPELLGMIESMKKTYGDSAMMHSMENMWGNFPAKPVRVGDKRSTKNENGQLLGLNTTYYYKLKKRNSKEAVIAMETKSSPSNDPNSGIDMGMAKITYDLSGGGDGSITLSQPDGLIKYSVGTIKLTGTMHMDRGDDMKIDVPLTISTKVTTKRIR